MENDFKECTECARKCENCEYFKEHFKKETGNSETSLGSWFLTVLAICALMYGAYYVLKEINAPKINIGGCELKIEEGSQLDYLIDSGVCSEDDIQNMVDSLLGQ